MAKLSIVEITPQTEIHSIDCGNASINTLIESCQFETIINQGKAYEIRLDTKIIGYSMIKIKSVKNYSECYESGLGDNWFTAIYPVYLAIDQHYQHKGYGSKILGFAINRSKEISKKLPIRYISFESLEYISHWYVDKGFQVFGKPNSSGNLNMFMDLLDIDFVESYISMLV